jgi:hypothetical protein
MLTTIVLCAATLQQSPQFEPPVRMRAGNEFVRTDPSGYAAPCWGDVTGDGIEDLLVGQFAGGRIKVHRGTPKGTLGKAEWLMAGGRIAEVPDVY